MKINICIEFERDELRLKITNFLKYTHAVLDYTFFVLDSTFWLDSTLKIDCAVRSLEHIPGPLTIGKLH